MKRLRYLNALQMGHGIYLITIISKGSGGESVLISVSTW